MKIIDLNDEQTEEIEKGLEQYDYKHITYSLDGRISIGIEENGRLIAGLDACMTAFRILYVSTVFVDAAHRRNGLGRELIAEMEKRAKKLGANTIRLDTFGYQGKDFYLTMGYKQVGFYRNEEDDYEEYFFLKRI